MAVIVFTRDWFALHQRELCGILNTRVVGPYLRRQLGIRSNDQIVQFMPDAYHTYVGRVGPDLHKFHFVVHPRAPFAVRLRKALYPFWMGMHTWDELIGDRWCYPRLSFGFTAFSVTPDVSSGATTVDGWVGRLGATEAWATLIAGAGTNVNMTDGGASDYVGFASTITSNVFERLYRAFFHFDTSSIGSGNTVTDAQLAIDGQSKTDGNSATPDSNIYQSNAALDDTLATGDFATVGSTAFCDTAITYAAFTTNSNVYTLNAAGLAAVSITGITKIAARNANYDVAATTPAWVSLATSKYTIGMADTGGAAHTAPTLSGNYTASGRTSKNTRAWPLGINIGSGFRMP
jgi:hypothetical protein